MRMHLEMVPSIFSSSFTSSSVISRSTTLITIDNVGDLPGGGCMCMFLLSVVWLCALLPKNSNLYLFLMVDAKLLLEDLIMIHYM